MAAIFDVDFENLVITLDTVGVTGARELDVFDIYTEYKQFFLGTATNRRAPFPFVSDGGNPLTSIIDQGGYIFLRNDLGWRFRPFEEDGTTFLIGNLAVFDTTLPAFVPTIGDFTAAILGLQPITQGVTESMAAQLEYGSFEGQVTVDVINGIAGTGNLSNGEAIGTTKNPSNNFTDALLIAAERGFDTFGVIGDATLGGSLDFSNFTIIGQGKNLSTLTIDTSANVLNATFLNAEVTGTLDGSSIINDSIINGLTFVSGVIEGCVLESSTITLGGNVEATFLDCYSGVPGTGTPTIDLGGSGQALALRGYAGGVRLENKTGPEAVSIDLRSGQVVIDLTTVTNGTIVVRGDGKVLDQAGNALISGTYGSMTLVNETISGVMVRELWQALNLDPDNAVTIDGNTIQFGGIVINITEPVPGTRQFTRL